MNDPVTVAKCEGCNEPLVDGGIDYYCANKDCDHSKNLLVKAMRASIENEQKLIATLLAKLLPVSAEEILVAIKKLRKEGRELHLYSHLSFPNTPRIPAKTLFFD